MLCLKKRRSYSFTQGACRDHLPQARRRQVVQVTEDTPADMLTGTMELLVSLPQQEDQCGRRITVQRATPMMDLLVQIATAHKLTASSYSLQVIGQGELVLGHQPNTPIGALDALRVKLVPKNKVKRSVNQRPFETTYRLRVHLPRNQLYVSRVSPRTRLDEILDEVCREKCLSKDKYELRQVSDQEEVLNPELSLQDYRCVQEVALHARPARPPRKRRQAPEPPKAEVIIISHSRNSSDSSGYHEASVLSDNPESLGRILPETLPRSRPKMLESRVNKSLENLSVLRRGISDISLNSNGRFRKKRAAPLPPISRPLSCAISSQGLERIADSESDIVCEMHAIGRKTDALLQKVSDALSTSCSNVSSTEDSGVEIPSFSSEPPISPSSENMQESPKIVNHDSESPNLAEEVSKIPEFMEEKIPQIPIFSQEPGVREVTEIKMVNQEEPNVCNSVEKSSEESKVSVEVTKIKMADQEEAKISKNLEKSKIEIPDREETVKICNSLEKTSQVPKVLSKIKMPIREEFKIPNLLQKSSKVSKISEIPIEVTKINISEQEKAKITNSKNESSKVPKIPDQTPDWDYHIPAPPTEFRDDVVDSGSKVNVTIVAEHLKREVISELESKIETSRVRLKSSTLKPRLAPVDNTLSNFVITTYPNQKNVDIFETKADNDNRILGTRVTLPRKNNKLLVVADDRNPRDQLLDSIKNFGGLTNLRKVKRRY